MGGFYHQEIIFHIEQPRPVHSFVCVPWLMVPGGPSLLWSYFSARYGMVVRVFSLGTGVHGIRP